MEVTVRLRVAVLISGRGSNMRALIDSCLNNESRAEIVLVISNRPNAGGLSLATKSGIETAVIDHKGFTDRKAFETELGRTLKSANVELICLAGFMRLLSPDFVNGWRDRLINIHPSLLPAFKGLNTHERAISTGVRVTGCTVHFVRPQMDDGPIIIQGVVPVHSNDTEEKLAERVLKMEHHCYPLAVQWIAEGRVRVIDEQAIVDNSGTATTQLINPER